MPNQENKYAQEEAERLQQLYKQWAENQQPKLNDIEKDGSVSVYSRLKTALPDVSNWIQRQFVEPSTNITQEGQIPQSQLRDQAYQEAEQAAKQIHEYNQNPTLFHERPSMPSKWQLLYDKGQVK